MRQNWHRRRWMGWLAPFAVARPGRAPRRFGYLAGVTAVASLALAVTTRSAAWLVPLALLPMHVVVVVILVARYRRRLADLDILTGLGTRAALERAVAQYLEPTADLGASDPRHGADSTKIHGGSAGRVGVFVLDLAGFQQVNAALGHAVGDRLLVEMAHRLVGAVGQPGYLARLGGAEFAVVVPHLPDVVAARHRAATLAEALAEPVIFDDLPVEASATIGVAVHPDHGADLATLLRHAEVARCEAKHRGDPVAGYAPGTEHHTAERLKLLADLRTAVEDPAGTDIALYYQPQVEVATGTVVGVEALLRWNHPEHGLVDPERLLRMAEQSAVMRLLTRRVLDEVIGQLAGWGAMVGDLRVSVNVSVRDLYTWEIADRVQERLSRLGIPAGRLQLEITEGALMADPHRVLATLTRLHRLGVQVALDDFGTGYSSMLHLRRLPLSEVKIDRSFVLGLASEADDAAIVCTMINLSRALGLRVVAEGVENSRTWQLLAQAGCDVAQGWYFARPMSAEQLVTWLARYRPRPARTWNR